MDDSYCAGLVDGEGAVGIQRKGANGVVRPYISVCMTHLPTLEALKAHFGRGTIAKRSRKHMKPHHLDAWTWTVKLNAAREIARRLLPHSITKLEQLKKVAGSVPRPTGQPRMVTISGVTMNLSSWCAESGVKMRTAQARIRRGWSERDAIFGRSFSGYAVPAEIVKEIERQERLLAGSRRPT